MVGKRVSQLFQVTKEDAVPFRKNAFSKRKNGVLLNREGLHAAVGPFVAADDGEVDMQNIEVATLEEEEGE